MFVRIKEDADMTIKSMKEQYVAQAEIAGTDNYAVLIDGRNNVTVPSETRQFMAAHSPINRKATAIVSNNNFATLLIANVYLKKDKPNAPTKLFKHEAEAIEWLKEQLA